MNLKRLLLLALFMSGIGIGGVQAEEGKWNDQAELSYVSTKGNSTVSTFSGKNELKYKFNEQVEGTWKIAALNSKSDGTRSAESYSTEARINYSISERYYAAIIIGGIKDNYAGIDSRYYIGPALGYKMLRGPLHFLHYEAGLDYVMEDNSNDRNNDFLRGRLFSQYEYHFNLKNKFGQSLEYLYDFDDGDNYNIISITALTTSVSDYMALKTSYEIRIDNLPVPSELKDRDTLFLVALVFNLS